MALANDFEQTSTTTREFTFEFLKQITDNFSEKHIIGRGGFGTVYKGVLENGEEIALKKLRYTPGLGDLDFKNEFNNLMRVQHPNITRLVGYCYHRGHQRIKYEGEYIFPIVEERVLCFEYLQGGSLSEHISDESSGLDWHTRFKIIKGVSLGLNYLHNGAKDPIYHLDLKPANIFLDKNMVPKIGDFGLSRLFRSAQTYIATKVIGTPGYMPREYIDRREITSKYDVFSLGVMIIRIMAGDEGYSKCKYMSSQEFLDHVHENWGKRLQVPMPSHTSDQIRTCIEISLRCVEVDREERPTIAEIADELNKVSDFESKPSLNQNTQSGYNLEGLQLEGISTHHKQPQRRIMTGLRRRKEREWQGRTPPLPFDAWSIEDEVHVTIGVFSPVEQQTQQGHPLHWRWLSWWSHMARLALEFVRVLAVVLVGILVVILGVLILAAAALAFIVARLAVALMAIVVAMFISPVLLVIAWLRN